VLSPVKILFMVQEDKLSQCDCCLQKFVSWTTCCLYRVTHLNCVNVGSQWRLTAFGCQNGYVVVAVFDVINKGTRFIEETGLFL